MNKHQLDRLFEEKLAAVQQEPSDKAKARFDQLMAQKHKKPVWIWWQVAAAVVVLGISTVTYLSWPEGDGGPLTADLPAITSDQVASHDEPAVSDTGLERGTDQPDHNTIDTREGVTPDPIPAALAVKDQKAETPAANPSDVLHTTSKDDVGVVSTIAVADSQPQEQLPAQNSEADASLLDEEADLELSQDIAVAINEPANEGATKKKRLPVTIIYKSSNAQESLVAMQVIRDDVDSLVDDRSNSLKSILQNAGNGALLAEFKKAKEDLLNLDLPLKTKKVEN